MLKTTLYHLSWFSVLASGSLDESLSPMTASIWDWGQPGLSLTVPILKRTGLDWASSVCILRQQYSRKIPTQLQLIKHLLTTYLLMRIGQNKFCGQAQSVWELIIQGCGYWEVSFTGNHWCNNLRWSTPWPQQFTTCRLQNSCAYETPTPNSSSQQWVWGPWSQDPHQAQMWGRPCSCFFLWATDLYIKNTCDLPPTHLHTVLKWGQDNCCCHLE